MLLSHIIPLISAVLSLPTLYIRPWGNSALCDPFQGAEVSIVTQALQTQSLALDLHYQFACLPAASSPQSHLALHPEAGVVGGLVLRSEGIQAGMTFSVPTFRAGLNMLRRKEGETGYWEVFSPLSISVWVLFLATPFIVGLCNFFYSAVETAELP